MKKALLLVLAVAVLGFVAPADKADHERIKIRKVAHDALGALVSGSETARSLYNRAYGYAVFDNLKITVMTAGDGGSGVAVDKASDERVYMKMDRHGDRMFQVVFLFEDEATFREFVESGRQAETVAVFQMTEEGLVASADLSGAKYRKHKYLND